MIKKSLILIMLGIVWWGSRGYVKAQKIECYTQYGYCSDDMSSGLGWLMNTPLLYPLPQEKVRRQLTAFPQIKSARLYRRLPRTLVVSVDLRKPIGSVGSQVLGATAVADAEGVVIGQQLDSSLPQLLTPSGTPQLKVGDRLDIRQSQALALLADIGEISSRKVLGRIDGSVLEVVLSDNIQVLLNLDYLGTDWKSTLQLILDRSKIQAKVPKTIDLRFSSPILKY